MNSLFSIVAQKTFDVQSIIDDDQNLYLSISQWDEIFLKTSPKGFSASKCDVGNWIFSKSWEFFGNSLGSINCQQMMFYWFLKYFQIMSKHYGQNKSKSNFTRRPRDIKILARFYKKYVAKQEYFAIMAFLLHLKKFALCWP